MTRTVLAGLLAVMVTAPSLPAAPVQLAGVRRAAKAAKKPVVITGKNDRIITDAAGTPVTDQAHIAKNHGDGQAPARLRVDHPHPGHLQGGPGALGDADAEPGP